LKFVKLLLVSNKKHIFAPLFAEQIQKSKLLIINNFQYFDSAVFESLRIGIQIF